MFYLNPKNGVSYNLVTQTPQYDIQSNQDLQNIPISGPNQKRPAILADVASIQRTSELASINHYNIRRVVDIYASVQGRDLGAVGREVTQIVDANRKSLPRGSFVTVRGQYGTMRTSYIGLIGGLGFAIILVYMLIVVNFQSWLDPFIIIHGSARRASRHYSVSLHHPYDAQCSGPDGSHYVHGCGHVQQYSRGGFRQGETAASRRFDRGRD